MAMALRGLPHLQHSMLAPSRACLCLEATQADSPAERLLFL